MLRKLFSSLFGHTEKGNDDILDAFDYARGNSKGGSAVNLGQMNKYSVRILNNMIKKLIVCKICEYCSANTTDHREPLYVLFYTDTEDFIREHGKIHFPRTTFSSDHIRKIVPEEGITVHLFWDATYNQFFIWNDPMVERVIKREELDIEWKKHMLTLMYKQKYLDNVVKHAKLPTYNIAPKSLPRNLKNFLNRRRRNTKYV